MFAFIATSVTQVTAEQDLKVLKGSQNAATHILRSSRHRLMLLSLVTVHQRKNGGNREIGLSKVEGKDNR